MMQEAPDIARYAEKTLSHANGVKGQVGMELLQLGASSRLDLSTPENEISSNDARLGSATAVQTKTPFGTSGLKNRKTRTEARTEERWLLICLPGKAVAKDPGPIEHLCTKVRIDDNSLIQEIKKSYNSGRSKWSRFRQLHGFSKVRMIKVRIATL